VGACLQKQECDSRDRGMGAWVKNITPLLSTSDWSCDVTPDFKGD
jgi:hypothetical protein